MTDSGISFIPKIIKTKDGHLYCRFRQGTLVVLEHIPGELSEDYSTEHYLNEYLKSIIDAESEGQKEEIARGLIGYLTDCWIYKRLDTADALCCPEKP